MKRLICLLSLLGGGAADLSSGIAFPEPSDGWTYIYHGDQATAGDDGSGFSSLDGEWSHDTESDAWDGSTLGGEFGLANRPGGVEDLLETGVDFLRMQDTGDPRDHGDGAEFADPGSNRKIFFIHDLSQEAPGAVLDQGLTITFRARIPATGLLDDLFPDGQTVSRPYPPAGDGYRIEEGGRGNIVVHQQGGGTLGFSLATLSEMDGGESGGLLINAAVGNELSGSVGSDGSGNRIELDPTEWHEFWIATEADPTDEGTHLLTVYVDGEETPRIFHATAGTATDYEFGNYIGLGLPSTSQSGAFDLDFLAYRPGVHHPREPSDPPLITRVVYDNSLNYLGRVVGFENGVEYGDEVQLDPSRGDVVSFLFPLFVSDTITAGTGEIFFRLNDGAEVPVAEGVTRSSPETELFSSGPFSLTPGLQTVELDLSSAPVTLPDSFSWTFRTDGLNPGASAGLVLFDPPVIGSSGSHFWFKGDNGWETRLVDGGAVAGNFGAVVMRGYTEALAPVQLQSPRIRDGEFSFEFVAESGATYRVEYKNRLGDAEWSILEVLSEATAGTVTVRDPAGDLPSRFYRVVRE